MDHSENSGLVDNVILFDGRQDSNMDCVYFENDTVKNDKMLEYNNSCDYDYNYNHLNLLDNKYNLFEKDPSCEDGLKDWYDDVGYGITREDYMLMNHLLGI